MDFSVSLIRALRRAERLAVLTGAGISAESGIPTFREAQTGLWAKHDPNELATPEAFRRDPRLVWEWYQWRRGLLGEREPNPAHLALVEIERRVPAFTLITQNVDGLHRRAGSHNLLELHGDIMRNKCSQEDLVIEIWEQTEEVPPRCPNCGSPLRPDVVWFGESLPRAALTQAVEAAQSADLFLSVGTSTVVQPAASLPFYALQAGALTVEVNTTETPFTERADYFLQGRAGELLPALVAHTWNA